MDICHIKSAVGGLDPDPVEAGNAPCAVSSREEQEGLEFPLAQDWSRRWPVEAQTLHVPKAERSRGTRRGAVAGPVEGRQTHLQGPAG